MRSLDTRAPVFAGLLLALGLLLSPVEASLAQSLGTTPAWEPADAEDSSTVSAGDPTAIAKRLFGALLGREPSALEVEQAARQIEGGQLDSLIGTLLASSEYRQQRASHSVESLLAQYYQALLGRSPDPAASRTYGPLLQRGDDAEVVRKLLDSGEFAEVLASQSLDASPLETACMKAVEDRLSADRRRPTSLRFLTIATATDSIITKEIRGTARLADGGLIEFDCTSERLRGSIVDVEYKLVEETVRTARTVRCESSDGRRHECAADTSGGVSIVRQLGRTACQQNLSWGFTDRVIWVDRGCEAEFRVMEVAAAPSQTLEVTAEGWGFLRQQGSQAVWFSAAALSCGPDGTARLTFSGESDLAFTGACYRTDDTQVQLRLTAGSGDWYTAAGGSVTVDGGAITGVSIGGRSRFNQPFSIAFMTDPAQQARTLTHGGEGTLELGDGRRAAITAVRLEPGSNGGLTLVFDGETRFGFNGSWFPTSTGDHEITVDGGLNDSSTRGAGTLRWSEDGSVEIDLVGTSESVGGAFRLSFKGRTPTP